jgi:hypothetical protein
LGLDKKLISQRVKGIYICVFGQIQQKTPTIHGGVPFREAEKIFAIPIPYAPKLLLNAGPSIWLAIEVDYVDFFNYLTL